MAQTFFELKKKNLDMYRKYENTFSTTENIISI